MSVFVFPMAGLSSRFYKSGYKKPKFQLMINNQTMFEWAVRSFEKYFSEDKFVFIIRNELDNKVFVEKTIDKLGISNYKIITLYSETMGQAETVYLGLNESRDFILDEDIFIFNIDSRREFFSKPNWIEEVDGYLELFIGEGDHWSFAKIDENFSVLKTSEKIRISDYCSNGLYYFKNFNIFNIAFQDQVNNFKLEKNEYYVAPLYNFLIQSKYLIKAQVINKKDILFCGTPKEYEDILKSTKISY